MAFTTVPQWLLGSGGTVTCVVTPVTIAADGTTTVVTASAKTITAKLRGVSMESSKEIEEISPITINKQNQVPISTGSAVDIQEIVPRTGISDLMDVAFGWDYVKVVVVGGSTPRTWTLECGPILNIGEPIQSKGSVTVTMRVGISAGNDANPTYA